MFYDDPLSDDDFSDGSMAGSDPVGGGQGDDSSSSDGDYAEQETLITREGLKKLKEELDNLKTVRRKEVAQRLKEAISYGDLSENSEYEEAKNEQAFVEGRILELEEKVKSAKIITEKKTAAGAIGKEVGIGSTVTINRREKDSDDEPESYTIVGATEADPFAQKISNESPIGKALLGRHKGETVKVHTPSGLVDYEIMKVS